MQQSDFDHTFKILLIGDSGVGKSSLLLRFTDDDFQEDHPCTIGVDFKTKIIDLDGKHLNLTIWDTAGQEKFRSLTSSYYRGTQGIILVYDVSKKSSFEALNIWLKEIDMYSTYPDVIKLLVGNKVDKEKDRAVSRDEGLAFAREKKMLFMECSAKTKLGVEQAFEELVQKVLDTPSLWEERPKGITKLSSPQNEQSSESYGCGGYCVI